MWKYRELEAQSDAEFASLGASEMIAKTKQVMAERGRVVIGLSGGSTPRPIYEAFAKSADIDWSRVFLFMVDERFTKKGSKDSLDQLLRESILSHAAIPEANLCFVPLQNEASSPQQSTEMYSWRLKKLFESEGGPDLVTLGMGDDGHIASLFPPLASEIVALSPDASSSSSLAITQPLAVHTTTDRFAVHDRISVTPYALQKSASSLLFLKGASKKPVWNEMTSEEKFNPARWPLHFVLSSGKLTLIRNW